MITLIIASLGLATGLFACFSIFGLIQSSQSVDRMGAENHFQSTIRLAQLEICYEHNIHPCDQEAIAKYYEAQPEEK